MSGSQRSSGGSTYSCKTHFVDFPAEIILHILSYLDWPDLAVLAQVEPSLTHLTTDPALHHYRMFIVSPWRVNHDLFATDEKGQALRPTVGELVQRGIMRGLNIERRWRAGSYIYSRDSILQYENGRRLARQHAQHVLSTQLARRTRGALKRLYSAQIMPDAESASVNVARALLPVMRRLKWSLRRDQLAQQIKKGPRSDAGRRVAFAVWVEGFKQMGPGQGSPDIYSLKAWP